jgi:hypothetical protein
MARQAGRTESLRNVVGYWRCAHGCICALIVFFVWLPAPFATAAVTPDSPEVQKLVGSALSYLEKNTDERLGGKCLIGLTFLKANRRDHPRVREALQACREHIKLNQPDPMLDVYSNGLAIIFLCELGPEAHRREVEWYLSRLKVRQKSHGGWGYHDMQTGDTSQTQYAALSYWEAHRHGFKIDGPSIEKLADWLIRTQDPEGCWGYQGNYSTTAELLRQTETNCSMLSAGLGCVYICADLFGLKTSAAQEDRDEGEASKLPAALQPVNAVEDTAVARKIRPQQTDVPKLMAAMHRAHGWMEENYQIDIGPKRYYYLYGLERYKSFQEAHEKSGDESPFWYNDGYEFLAKDQAVDGSWRGYCGPECDTAFSVLFLLRSTKKSLRARLGEGKLLAGRGLPTDLSRAKLRGGQLIVEQVNTRVDELLARIEDGDASMLDELAHDPSQLVVEEVDSHSARRLQQLLRGGEPEVRLLAVRALGRTGSLDYVPSLLYALTDPDKRVVLEAREGLKFISRNFIGYGPPDDFTEQQRYQSIDAWKKWYQSLRPNVVLPPLTK